MILADMPPACRAQALRVCERLIKGAEHPAPSQGRGQAPPLPYTGVRPIRIG